MSPSPSPPLRAARAARTAWLLPPAVVLAAACASSSSAGDGDDSAAGVAAAAQGAKPPATDTGTATDPAVARADRARVQGDSTATVWVIEVSDMQCPYCRLWHERTYPALRREYVETGKVRLAYVHLPLPNHRHAWPAAEASMCAGAQGQFWRMHDLIFATQPAWSPQPTAEASFDTLAARVGLDMAAYRQCLASDVMLPLIQHDYDRSVRAGVSSTPSFIIGDRMLPGAFPIDSFRVAIDAALAKARGQGQRGTP